MLQSVAYFLPAIFCFLGASVGLAFLGVSLLVWRKRRHSAAGHVPPKLENSSVSGNSKRGSLWWKLPAILGLASLALALTGLWLTGFSVGWQKSLPVEWTDGRAPQLEELIRARCSRFMARGNVGLAVAVVSDKQSTVMTFGRQSLAAGPPVSGDTLFEIGSITKTFTALVLAREVGRGHLRLDQPVRELLPPGTTLPEPARDITFKELTTHTSGFPRLPANLSKFGPINMWLFGSNPYQGLDETTLLNAVQDVQLEFEPRSQSHYSNFGVLFMGYLLARQAGTNYEALIKQEVCRPLGMSNTTVVLSPEQSAHYAQGYRSLIKIGPLLLGLRAAPWFQSSTLGGAGALRSSATDMLRYLEAQMHPSGPLEDALRESHRELFHMNDRSAIAMNWMRTKNPQLKQTLIWHNGGTGGFRSFLGFTQDGRLGVVVLCNAAENVDPLGLALLRDLNEQ